MTILAIEPPEIPPPPSRPGPGECCGSGCTPCVFDLYRAELKSWKARIVEMGLDPGPLLRRR